MFLLWLLLQMTKWFFTRVDLQEIENEMTSAEWVGSFYLLLHHTKFRCCDLFKLTAISEHCWGLSKQYNNSKVLFKSLGGGGWENSHLYKYRRYFLTTWSRKTSQPIIAFFVAFLHPTLDTDHRTYLKSFVLNQWLFVFLRLCKARL